jgi:hypothetical protein
LCVVRAMPIARQRVAKHIPAEANARNNTRSIARQRHGKQALSTIQAVFREIRAKCLEESQVPKLAFVEVQNENKNGARPSDL